MKPGLVRAPRVVPQPGWTPVEPLRLEGGLGSFVSGEPGGDRLRVRCFRRDSDGSLVGRAWFGPGSVGPPGHAHGGSMAAVLDEAMGAAAWMQGLQVVAVRLVTHFRRMLPVDTDALMAAWVERTEGKKVWTGGRLTDDRDQVFAEAEGLFVRLDPDRFRDLLEVVTRSFGGKSDRAV